MDAFFVAEKIKNKFVAKNLISGLDITYVANHQNCMQLESPIKSLLLSAYLSVHLSVNIFSENWLIIIFIPIMTGFRFS